ncbi:hypothetical protein ACFV4N_38410 [Actinosynnema sp. NPDC059797]
MGKHRLGRPDLGVSDGSQWGGPDLLTRTAAQADTERMEPVQDPVAEE